jgi:hypothetical protein
MVAEAQARGEVDPGLDPGWSAFFLDDILMMTQYSVGSAYYRARLELFLGQEVSGPACPPGDLVARLLELVLRALSPRS